VRRSLLRNAEWIGNRVRDYNIDHTEKAGCSMSCRNGMIRQTPKRTQTRGECPASTALRGGRVVLTFSDF